jgi:hypothetical protein
MPLPNAPDPTSSSSTSFSVHPFSVQPGEKNFVDRRSSDGEPSRPERRQFGSSHAGLSDDGRELALAIDEYKVQHHRRYLTCDEMLKVLWSLGYVKQS